MHSGCGADTRDLQFESTQTHQLCLNCIEMTNIMKKLPGMAHFVKIPTFTSSRHTVERAPQYIRFMRKFKAGRMPEKLKNIIFNRYSKTFVLTILGLFTLDQP